MTSALLQRHDVQGNILRAYRFRHAHYLLISAATPDGARELLRDLLPDITTMAGHAARDSASVAVNLAITYAGFARFGVPDALLGRFPAAFRATTRDRAALLGDTGPSDPSTWPDGVGTGAVHFLVSVHADDAAQLAARVDAVRALAARVGAVVDETAASMLPGKREHFGYADGAAQPDVEGVGSSRQVGGGVPLPDGGWRPVKLGEFVLGYPDEDGAIAQLPDPDLVRNGSYLVYRKLAQDVARFERRLAAAARTTGLSAELVAAKIVGRWRDGVPVVAQPVRPDVGDLATSAVPRPVNDFRYLPADADGFGCPLGAHIRRTNPRDALTFDGAISNGGRLTARHRIIRRGMPYGPDYRPDEPSTERGLVFVCYNADIAQQFETIQTEWCNGGNAFDLGADVDYLIGPPGGSGKMTIPRQDSTPAFVPVTDQVVTTRGAEYLFAPGMAALQRLATGGFA